MFKGKSVVAVFIFFVSFTLFNCAGENVAIESTLYEDLVSLNNEFDIFQQPETSSGVPDYSAAAMEEKYRELKTYQNRLKAIDPGSWSVPNQVDYHLVRAEMNGYEFQHRVLRPWLIDPGFYNVVIRRYGRVGNLPLDGDALAGLRERLQSVSAILEQATVNLNSFSDISGDLGTLAVLSLGDTRASLEALSGRLAGHHPGLAPDVERALAAIDDYIGWIEANKSKMTARAGVGKENYNWLLKNVYLFPYTWEDIRTIVELEDNRVRTFQKLEENRNRNVPAIKPVQSQEEYKASVSNAIDHIMDFIRDEEIFTIDDFLTPDDYFGSWHGFDNPWPEKHDYFFNFSHREPVMEESHEMVGHHFDGLRSRNDDRPVRGGRRPYKIGTARHEGFAFALEEQAILTAGMLMAERSPMSRLRSERSGHYQTSTCTARTGVTLMQRNSASTTRRMENCLKAVTICGLN